MRPNLLLFPLLLLFFGGSSFSLVGAEDHAIYSKGVRFDQSEGRVIDEISSLNTKTGHQTHVVDTFVHTNITESIPNLSTVDRKRSIVYYVTDYIDFLIYSADVHSKVALPPISLHMNGGIGGIQHSAVLDSLIVYGIVVNKTGGKQAYIVQYPPLEGKMGPQWFQLPSDSIGAGMAFDGHKGTAYFAKDLKGHTQITLYNIHTRESSVTNVSCFGLSQLYYDASTPEGTSPLWASRMVLNRTKHHHGVQGLEANLLNIDITSGECTLAPLTNPIGGILRATAFNDQTGDFHYVIGSGKEGVYINTFNVRTKDSYSAKIDGPSPDDIMI